MTRRGLLLRVLAAAAAYAAARVMLHILDAHADDLRLGLLALLVVAVLGLLLDTTPLSPTPWAPPLADETRLDRLDPRTASHLRLLEGHLASRTVDDGLRRRLRDLAERALRTRHDLALDDPGARALLGPDLVDVLDRAPYRLRDDQIERCLRRIEEL